MAYKVTLKVLKTKPLVLITWKDITSSHTGWFEETKDLTTATIKSPCWVIEETEKDIKAVSALGWHDNKVFFGFDTVIPKGCIESIKILKKQWWR